MQIENWPLARFVEYGRNPRQHDHAVDGAAAAIRRFGFRVPVIARSDGTVVDGHLRLKAARKLGLEVVPVVLADDMTEAEVKAFRISVNRVAELADWDNDLLALELSDLADLDFDLTFTGFDEAAIAAILSPPDPEPEMDPEPEPVHAVPKSETAPADPAQAEADPDALPATPAGQPAVSRPGDVWILGSHRLICGDSCDPATYAALMPGEAAHMLFTSPPYGQQRDYGEAKEFVRDWQKLMMGVFRAVPMHGAGQIIVNLGLIHRENEWLPYWDGWMVEMRRIGWRRFGLYVWDQGPGLMGDWAGRLAPSFELLFHFNRRARKPNKTVEKLPEHIKVRSGGALRAKNGAVLPASSPETGLQTHKIPDSVFRIMRHKGGLGEVGSHPAVFPVALPEAIITAWTAPGEIVLEPFCGSGTTLVAGERTGRAVRAVDIDPAYVDLAIRRWQQASGHEAVLESGGAWSDVAKARNG